MTTKRQTPWGQADNMEALAAGIISYSTPSHGGIWLSAERQRQLGYKHNFLNNPEWWEEDCDWAVPYVFFQADIRASGKAFDFEGNLKAALEIIKRCHLGFRVPA